MNRLLSIFFGLALIGLGLVALVLNVFMPVVGPQLWLWGITHLWPVFVVGVGLCFVAVPLLNWKGWAGAFFIPGLPILTTGGILLLSSVAQWGGLWHWAWPLEVLSLAIAFVLMALWMRNVWILVPAIFIGLNGLVLQFCALTGQWEAWAVLWPIEPLAVGLTILLTAFKTRNGVVFLVGMGFCLLSGAAMVGMMTLLSGAWRLAGMASAAGLILLGGMVLVWAVLPRRANQTAMPAAN